MFFGSLESSMSTLETLKSDWNLLGEVDPLWAVLSSPDKQHGKWNVGEFYATGEKDITELLTFIETVLCYPLRHGSALDFGCGPGRLTNALTRKFAKVTGVDISSAMLDIARSNVSAEFIEISSDTLPFPDRTFDFLCTFHVLQHVPSAQIAYSYIREFIRVLAPGGLAVFHVPVKIPLQQQLQLRRRAFRVISLLGISKLYDKLHLTPIRMTACSRESVRTLCSGAEIVRESFEHQANRCDAVTFFVKKV